MANQHYLSATLSTGRISVEVESSLVPAESLFGFAERCNPKRSFLFVSKVLGRHIPVSPAAMRETYQLLASQIPVDAPGPVLVTGMAETAIGLGAGVHQEYAGLRNRGDAVFLATTRYQLGVPVLAEFQEEHSHASHHLVYRPTDPDVEAMVMQARTLVLVDDEASTGNTFVNLCRALEGAGLDQVEQIYLVTLTDWSSGRAVAAVGDRAKAVTLLSGRYHWEQKAGAVAPVMPVVEKWVGPQAFPDPLLDWGRLGVTEHARTSWGRVNPELYRAGANVLVVGVGEHVWQPFLFAEWLERLGSHVKFSSVTRSPIANGHAINRSLAFHDSYGQGIPNFLYNVDPDAYDHIFLCSETGVDCIDPRLLEAIRPELISETPAYLNEQALAS